MAYGVETSKIKEARDKLPELRLSSFLSRNWVLVPNGSLLGFFDWVPENLRVGPWKPVAPLILLILGTVVVQYRPSQFFHESDSTLVSSYQEPFSIYWYYNLFSCASMLGLVTWIAFNRAKGVVVTYTILSWILNAIAHGINALAPFLHDHHHLLQINRMIRFPSLVSATLTFVIWNVVLLPYIYFGIYDTKEKKANFLKWNLEFRMVQIHLCNIIYSILNTIVTGRSEDMVKAGSFNLFDSEDLWYGLAYGYCYGLFYTLVLDRIGVHIYPIFSPRSNLVAVTWLTQFGLHYAFYKLWNYVMQSSLNEFLSLPILFGVSSFLTASAATAKLFLKKSDS
mmetsp:Transcript_5528/g.6783  ORF Transcript_5528/g.6783 Transcript_5528/m.6783 type:complete len:339 (-) Transcript_5528:48-1064(-)